MSEEYPEYKRGEEQDYEGDGPRLRYDEFVERIVKDPKEPPGVTLLSGYLGASSEEACVRLYLDEELSRYVEIPEKAILHTQELTPEQSPLGGSLVWIDSGAEVAHGAAGMERRWATFLEGQITQDYMGAAQPAAFGGLSGSTQTRECFTPPSSYGPECGTSKSGPCIPQTEAGCRTRTGILCTRLGPNCGRTSYDPVCTVAGPDCRTLVFFQCQPSVHAPCVTHDIECQASGYFPCNPPIDFTIWQGQFGHPGGFGFAGGRQAFPAPQPPQPTAAPACGGRVVPTQLCAAATPMTQSRECVTRLCPSAVDVCPTRFNCPSANAPCQSYHHMCPTVTDSCQSAYGMCPTGGGLSCASRQYVQCGATHSYGCITQVGCGMEGTGGGF